MTDPTSQANSLNNSFITSNNRGQITGAMLHTVIAAVIGAGAAIGGQALTGTLANPTALPASNASICAPGGSTVTLPSGTIPNTVEYVADCTPGADTNPQPLPTPTTINASTDATIEGAASYQLTLTGQSVGFRKTAAGPWKPF